MSPTAESLNIPAEGDLLRDKIKERSALAGILERFRGRGGRVIFTNGCFDLLHCGHTRYLHEARGLGDCLIVGVNSDNSVRGIKGEGRPINDQDGRAEVLAALADVDYVVLFDEPTPLELIKALKPDVVVKGGDWRPEEIVGKDIVESGGGEVLSLPYVENKSSSDIIDRILDLHDRRKD